MNNTKIDNIEGTDIKLIFITNINNLLNEFFKTVKTTDKKTYFMNEEIKETTNFNDWVVKNLTNEQINFLKINIKYSFECLEYLDKDLKNSNMNLDYNIWKICVFSKMFFNLPFTLEDVIFIPLSYIGTSIEKLNLLNLLFGNSNLINKNFSKTLIHEKIHLLQRYNQKKWDDYIIKKTKWIIKNEKNIYNSTLINNNKIIYNPDTYYVNNNFAYFIDNKYYRGEMFLNSNGEIKNIWYEIINSNNKSYLYPISYSVVKYEHPYEELAYDLSNKLVNN